MILTLNSSHTIHAAVVKFVGSFLFRWNRPVATCIGYCGLSLIQASGYHILKSISHQSQDRSSWLF